MIWWADWFSLGSVLEVAGPGGCYRLPVEKGIALKCPICSKPVRWEGNTHRPFCSERCQTLDLGNWATDHYTVPVENTPEIEDAEEALAEE